MVTLTHDPKIDDPGLVEALRSDAFYIGCLGSRRTHAARCERLAEAVTVHLVAAFLTEGPKDPIPDDEDSGVVGLPARAVMDAMV